ncbi:MAG: ATP-binding protein, partial [Haladaptatus sp.]
MNSGALDVIEFLLTARIYSENRDLDENDLPPAIRQVFWHDGTIERPLRTTIETAREATGLDQPWEAISELMFTDRDTFSGGLELTQQEMAEEWLVDRDEERVERNPALAYALEDRDGVDVTYDEVREANRPVQSDRAWIDSLLE